MNHDNIREQLGWASTALAGLSAAATAYCYFFGYQGFAAYLFAALGFMCCLVQPRLAALVYHNRKDMGWGMLAVGVLGLVLTSSTDLTSNFQTISAARSSDIQEARLQTASYVEVKDDTKENAELLAGWKAHIKRLDKLKDWEPTVTATEMRAKIANLEGDYIYKRSKQCSSVTRKDSRAFCDKLEAARTSLGRAEKRADYAGRIAALQRVVGEKREKFAKAKTGDSFAMYSVQAMSSLTTWDGSAPSVVVEDNINKMINTLLALALFGLPMILAIWSATPGEGHGRGGGGASGSERLEASQQNAAQGHTMTPGGTQYAGNAPAHTLSTTPPPQPAHVVHGNDGSDGADAVAGDVHIHNHLSAAEPQAVAVPLGGRIVRVQDTAFARRVVAATQRFTTPRDATA